jgi:ribonuclease G
MSSEIIMNVTPGETRIARFLDGVLQDLSIERDSDLQVAGNIYLGKVTRVLPGMQAAFVDIGLDRAAFLYVADIVPDLFEGVYDEDDEEESEENSEDKNVSDENSKKEEPSDKSDVDEEVTENTTVDEVKSSADKSEKESKDSESDSKNEDSEKSEDQTETDKSEKSEKTDKTDKKDDKRRSRSAGSSRGRRQARGPRKGGGRGHRRKRAPLPRIEDVIKPGEEVTVQIVKEPIRTKGARITSHISLPGRYLVFMPTVNHVGVSRRIGSYEERSRLKKILRDNKPAHGGFIARTSCEGVPEEKLVADINNLKAIWQKVYEKKEESKPPCLLHKDMDIVLRFVRDNLTDEINRMVIDSKEDFDKVCEYVDANMPELRDRVELYDSDTPLFDVYGIENEINRALGKKVWLKSGGYLIIDTAEALTVIDINTGKFVGKKDFDETVMTTNLEAAEEIAYQLKLRSIGGIIIIDFIDMNRYSDRMKVYRAFKDELRKDRVKTTLSKISDLGLIEMTRKRTRDSLTQMLSETCVSCHGTGFIKTPMTVAFSIFREIKRVHSGIASTSVLVQVHPRVAKVLFNEGRDWLEALEKSIGKRIVIETTGVEHVGDYEIRGRDVAVA